MATTTRENKWLQYIPVFITVAGFLFGVYQYNHQSNKNLKEKFRQELWMKKKDIYIEFGSILGTIAAGPKSDTEFRDGYLKFAGLYYGSGAMVADTTVYKCLTDIMHTFFLEFDYKDVNKIRLFREQVKQYDDACQKSLNNDLNNL